MEQMTEPPLAVYQAALERGELAYQWSLEAKRAVFYPRVSSALQWQQRPRTARERGGSARFYTATRNRAGTG